MIKEGILNFYKPSGVGSNDCIYKMRRAVGVKKIGHTGTLDPMAEGVLPLCIGSASRITEYLDLDFKSYRCTMQLGWETDTLDATGEVLFDNRDKLLHSKNGETGDDGKEGNNLSIPTIEAVKSAFERFHGYVEQLPPKYSAVWVDGRRLYNYARAGEEVEIPKRRIFIKDIKLVGYVPEELSITYDVVCSKGTYIRSICRDVGEILGTAATMTALTRTSSGVFKIEDCHSVEELAQLETLRNAAYEIEKQILFLNRFADDILKEELKKLCETELGCRLFSAEESVLKLEWEKRKAIHEAAVNALLLSADYPLVHFGSVTVNESIGRDFCNGWHVSLKDCSDIEKPEYAGKEPELEIRPEYRRAYRVYMQQGEEKVFLGVAFFDNKYHKLVADKVFYKRFSEKK